MSELLFGRHCLLTGREVCKISLMECHTCLSAAILLLIFHVSPPTKEMHASLLNQDTQPFNKSQGFFPIDPRNFCLLACLILFFLYSELPMALPSSPKMSCCLRQHMKQEDNGNIFPTYPLAFIIFILIVRKIFPLKMLSVFLYFDVHYESRYHTTGIRFM